MRNIRTRLAAAACVLLFAAAPAAAQDTSGAYAGFAFGRFDYDETNGGGALELSDDTEVYRLFGGYRIGAHFAIEGAWSGAPGVEGSARGDFPAFPNASVEIDYEILALKGVALWPINQFGFLTTVGYYDSDADVTVSQNGAQLLSTVEDEKGVSVAGGVFFDLERLTLRAEYQLYDDLNGADVTELTLGVLFRF